MPPKLFISIKPMMAARPGRHKPFLPLPVCRTRRYCLKFWPEFTSPSDGILPIRFTGETYRTGFYVTRDGGANLEIVTFLPGSGSVDFVSLSDGFFWTGEQFFLTEDGAQTWTTINSDVLFGESFSGMDFVNMRTGWVWTYTETGQYGLYKTTDGGATWVSMVE